MRFRVLAKGYTESGAVRERYQFNLLCTQQHAEQVARCYLTHLQGKGGMWTVRIEDIDHTRIVFNETNYARPLDNLINMAASGRYASPSQWVTTTTGTTNTSLWDTYARRSTSSAYANGNYITTYASAY